MRLPLPVQGRMLRAFPLELHRRHASLEPNVLAVYNVGKSRADVDSGWMPTDGSVRENEIGKRYYLPALNDIGLVSEMKAASLRLQLAHARL